MASSAQLKTKGFLLLASFFAVLIAIFMPLFPGTQGEKVNGLDYLDNFFNQLSKSSAYYIPEQLKKAEKYQRPAIHHLAEDEIAGGGSVNRQTVRHQQDHRCRRRRQGARSAVISVP